MNEPALERSLEAELATGAVAIGEVLIRKLDDGMFELTHRGADVALAESFPPDQALEVAKHDAAGKYRPLRTAPNLSQGWKIIALDFCALHEAIDSIYPGRLAVWQAWKASRLMTTPLRETLNRQSGMYRIAAKISDSQIDELVGNFCRSNGGCLRTILWRRNESGATLSPKLPPEKFDPAFDQTGRGQKSVPLLCQEACNLLVAACRDMVKPAPTAEETVALELREQCEKCGKPLPRDGAACICIYECTFCPECSAQLKNVCPNCGGELVRRPRPAKAF